MAFMDNFNVLFEHSLATAENKEMKFALMEKKSSGELKANIREFKTSETYQGATKNGMLLNINTKEDIEKYQKQFNDYFEEMKKYL